MKEANYALGYTEAELRRLTTQAGLIDPITRRFREAAGIRNGMRVLEIGSGAGDVALLCGELVGPAGKVSAPILLLQPSKRQSAALRPRAQGMSHSGTAIPRN